MSDDLQAIRDEIRRIDAELVRLAARRMHLASEVGELKAEQGLTIRNYAVEAEVIRTAREQAREAGLREEVAEALVTQLISESLRVQERDRRGRAQRARGTGRRALVVGGAGQMGRWFVEFLDSKGFGVSVADPRGAPEGHPLVKDVGEDAGVFDLIVVATPPSAVGPVFDALAHRTDALVFEIGSLKAPFLPAIRKLAAAGASITSVHPMWGPRTDLLASKNVIVCDCGNAAANRAARALFEDTAAHVVEIPVEAHDAYMAQTLGVPHAVNLLFGHALARQPHPLAELVQFGGPTFLKQVAVAREVAGENKDLYFEIQKLNPHTLEALSRLRRSLEALEAGLASREAFRAYMAEAEAFFQGGTR